MEELRTYYREYKEAQERADRADEAWERDPENEAKEKEFDEAYNAEFKAYERLADKAYIFCKGKIDSKTMRMMITTRQKEFEAIIGA